MTSGRNYSTENAEQQRRDDATSPNPNVDQILPGTTVFGANGDQLGTVSERGFVRDLLEMRRGGAAFYLPITAITRTGTDGVFTTLRPDDLDKLQSERAAGVEQRQANAATDRPERRRYDLDIAAGDTGATSKP